MPGPAPNRPGDHARERDAARGGKAWTPGTMRPVTIPSPPDYWDNVIVMAWESLQSSGMADFYQNSDWAYAYVVLDELAAYRRKGTDPNTGQPYPTHKVSGQMFAALTTALTKLGMAEGDRRSMRIALEQPPSEDKPAQLVAMDGYKDRLKKKKSGGNTVAPEDNPEAD